MKAMNILLVVLAMAFASVSVTGCLGKKESKVEQTADDAADAVEDAGDATGDAMEDAGDAAADEMTE